MIAVVLYLTGVGLMTAGAAVLSTAAGLLVGGLFALVTSFGIQLVSVGGET